MPGPITGGGRSGGSTDLHSPTAIGDVAPNTVKATQVYVTGGTFGSNNQISGDNVNSGIFFDNIGETRMSFIGGGQQAAAVSLHGGLIIFGLNGSNIPDGNFSFAGRKLYDNTSTERLSWSEIAVILNIPLVLKSYTVATLPSASTSGVGATAFVTDASTSLILGLGGTVAGGGSNKVPVYSDGTNWIYG